MCFTELMFRIRDLSLQIIHEIQDYFEKFGEVVSIRMHAQYNFQYGLVQFKMAETAKKVLSRSPHWIGGCAVEAKVADLWHQPVDPLLIPPDQESDSNIINALDDDCLREIFKHLNVVDLSCAAEVCVRFNQHAQEVISTKHKTVFIGPEFIGSDKELMSI